MEPILWGKRRLIYATVGSHSRSSNFCGMQLSWSCLGNRVLSLTCRWSKGLLYFTCWDVKTHWSGGILSHPGVYFGWIAIILHIWRCVQSVGLRWSLVPNVEYDIFMFGPNDALIYCVCWNVKIHRLLLSIVKKYIFNVCSLCCGFQSINCGKYRRLEMIRCLLWCGFVPSLIICREGMRSKSWSVLMLN